MRRVACYGSMGGPPPTLTSNSLDVIQSTVAGAYNCSMTFGGTNLGAASAFSINSVTYTINSKTSTTVSVTGPAQAAGSYTAKVTTPGGTATYTVWFEDNPIFYLSADRATLSGSAVTGVPRSDNNSGFDFSLTQSTSANRPTISASNALYNNHASVEHASASSQYLKSGVSSLTSYGTWTLYIVGLWKSFGGGHAIIDDTEGTSRVCVYDNYTNAGRINLYTGSILAGVTAITTNTPYVFCFEQDTAIGQYEYSPETLSGGAAYGSQITSLLVGCRYDLSAMNFFNGSWTMMSAYQGLHNSTVRTRNISRLKTLYNLP